MCCRFEGVYHLKRTIYGKKLVDKLLKYSELMKRHYIRVLGGAIGDLSRCSVSGSSKGQKHRDPPYQLSLGR